MKQALHDVILRHRLPALLLGILLVLNVVLFGFVSACQQPELSRKRHERAGLAARQPFAGRGDAAESFRVAGRDLERLRAMIPSKRGFPAFLQELLDSASSCAVALGPVAYKQSVVKERKLLAYEVTMSVAGRYGGVKAFLFDLQMLEGLAVIDGISLSSDDPYTEQVTMEARLTVYLRDDA